VHIIVDVPPGSQRWQDALRRLSRRPLRRIRLFGVAFGLIGLGILVLDHGTFVGRYTGIVLLVCGLLLAVLLPARALRAGLKRLPASLVGQPHRFELTDHSFRSTSPLMNAEYAWEVFEGTDFVPGYLFLKISSYGNQAIPVPLDGLAPAQLDELRAFVAARALVPR
jgi:uncharacterized protein YjeT (DUF2065 family)